MTAEEAKEFAADRIVLRRQDDDPRDQDYSHLSDKVEWDKPRKDLVGKSWQEKAEILFPKKKDPHAGFTPDFQRTQTSRRNAIRYSVYCIRNT